MKNGTARRRLWSLALVGSVAALVAPWGGAEGAIEGECEKTWAGGVGLWNVDEKWSPWGVPTSADLTCITTPGNVVTVKGGGSVEGLTLGELGAPATLKITGYEPDRRSSEIRLDKQEGADGIAPNSVLVLETMGEGFAWLNGSTEGDLVNDGKIHASAGGGGTGPLFLYGDLLNNGVLDVDKSLFQEAHRSDWLNNGTIDIAAGASLVYHASSGSFRQLSPDATIVNNGSFRHVAGPFLFAGGVATGNPLTLESATIAASGGSARIDVTQSLNTLAADIGAGITLRLLGLPGANADLGSPDARTNNGTFVLETSGNGWAAVNSSSSSSFVNDGTMIASAAGGGSGSLFFAGDLVNNGTFDVDKTVTQWLSGSDWRNAGTLDIAAKATVDLAHPSPQSFTQTSAGTLKIRIDSSSTFGKVVEAGAISLDGELEVARKSSFKPSSGSFPIVSGFSRLGTFDNVRNAVIARTRYLRPVYSGSGVALEVTTATLEVAPASGRPGTQVTLSGSGYPGDDSIALKFKDASGRTAALAPAVTDATGSFSVTRAVPGSAAPGAGKFSAKSAIAAVTAKRTFDVT